MLFAKSWLLKKSQIKFDRNFDLSNSNMDEFVNFGYVRESEKNAEMTEM